MSFPTRFTYTALRTLPAFRPSLSATTRQLRFYEVPHKVTFDQTKKNNDPKEEEDPDTKPQSNSEQESHPQKQPDPQKTPSSATGIQTEGPGDSKAGKGSAGV